MTRLAYVVLGSILWGGAVLAAPQDASFAGSETCQTCHEDIYKALLRSPHGKVEQDSRRGWKGRACESCHGAGQKHAESADAAAISNPLKLSAAAADKVCL